MFRKIFYIRRNDANISDMQKYQSYLPNGRYYLVLEKNRHVWRKDGYFQWLVSVIRANIRWKRKLRELISPHTYVVHNSTDNCLGESLYVTRKGNAKIFDTQNKLVTYFVQDSMLLDRASKFNSLYSPFFGDPVIKSIDIVQMRITERFVEEVYNWRLTSEGIYAMFDWLLKCERQYLLSINKFRYVDVSWFENYFESCSCEDRVKELVCGILNHLQHDSSLSIPIVIQHNDLVLSNILAEKNGFTLFDYEFSSENIFYYDVFLWFVWEAVNYGRYKYVDLYLNGKFDIRLKPIFDAVGIAVDVITRIRILYLFVLANIRIHVIYGDKTNVTKYAEFIKYLRDFEKNENV